jgi:hypothetical protein
MNEQIEYLFDQALEEFKAENKYTTIVVPDPLQRDFVEKFAALIVKECAGLAEDGFDDELDGQEICDSIKQHFGV